MTHHLTIREANRHDHHAVTTDLAQLTGTYTIDPQHTRIGFVARHAMVTKVRGAFNEFDGHGRASTRPTRPPPPSR